MTHYPWWRMTLKHASFLLNYSVILLQNLRFDPWRIKFRHYQREFRHSEVTADQYTPSASCMERIQAIDTKTFNWGTVQEFLSSRSSRVFKNNPLAKHKEKNNPLAITRFNEIKSYITTERDERRRLYGKHDTNSDVLVHWVTKSKEIVNRTWK